MTRAHCRKAMLVAAVAALAGCGGDDEEPRSDTPSDRPPETSPSQAEPAARAPARVPEGATASQVQQGQQVFAGQGICFTCHASDGSGTVLGPDLTDEDWLWIDTSAGDVLTQITTVVRTGVSDPMEHSAPMPPMGGAQLSDDQVEAVAAYVYSLSDRG